MIWIRKPTCVMYWSGYRPRVCRTWKTCSHTTGHRPSRCNHRTVTTGRLNLTPFGGKADLSPFRGYTKATPSGGGCFTCQNHTIKLSRNFLSCIFTKFIIVLDIEYQLYPTLQINRIICLRVKH